MGQNNLSLIPFSITKNQGLIYFLIAFVSFAISFFLWFQVDIDKSILFALNNQNFNGGFTEAMRTVSHYGMSAITLTYLFYLIFSVKSKTQDQSPKIFLLVIFSFAVAGISGDLMKEVFGRIRPMYIFESQLSFLTSSGSPSFPSGHATKSLALVIPFLFYSGYKGYLNTAVKSLLIFIALLVCFSRINLGAHYLSDIAGAIAWVFLCLPVAVFITNKILSKMNEVKLEYAVKKWVILYAALTIVLAMI